MRFLCRVMSLVTLALLLQAGAGMAHAHVPADAQINAYVMQQETIALDYTGLTSAAASDDCADGACGGLTCSCACHGVAPAITVMPMVLPAMPKTSAIPLPPRSYRQIGSIPPARPPKA